VRDSDDKKRESGVEEFARDKRRRNRTVSVEAVTRSPRVERTDDGERPTKPERPGWQERGEKPERPQWQERPERPERPQWQGGGERPERPQWQDRGPKPERPQWQDRGPRPERPQWQERGPRPERPQWQERGPRPENQGNYERPQRRSYNPNFSSDNKFIGGGGKPERDFNRWDTPSDRPQRPYEKKPYGQGTKARGPKTPFGPKKPFAKKGAGGMDPGAKPDFYPSYSTSDNDKELRLNRYIAMSGKCSRREADELIAKGEVTVNGNVVTEMGVKVMPGDDVRLKGEKLSNERKVYIIINKPKGFVTSLDDPHAEKTVMDIVRNACTERIYPVGRLDKSSVGVLLLTNDGDLTEKLTHPSHNKKKVYQVTLERPLTNMDLQKARDGIDLDDGVIIPDAVDFTKPDNRKEVGIEIHSGRNRIVRRIFEELGYGVHKLDRVYFAGLTKKNLKRGQWRFLTDKEVAMLKSGRYE
jgi:23S rRNA pseudouridine2605 synthase